MPTVPIDYANDLSGDEAARMPIASQNLVIKKDGEIYKNAV